MSDTNALDFHVSSNSYADYALYVTYEAWQDYRAKVTADPSIKDAAMFNWYKGRYMGALNMFLQFTKLDRGYVIGNLIAAYTNGDHDIAVVANSSL